MKKIIIVIPLVAALIFTGLSIVGGKKEIRKYEYKNVELQDSQSIEEIENMEPEESQFNEQDLMRFDSQNGIDMAVVFNNLLEDDKEFIVFKVMVNNHRFDLEGIKYAELSKLSFNEGTEINEGFQWELEGGGGHHISGYLKLPKTYNGNNLIIDKVDSIQLEMEGVGGDGKLQFEWDKEVILSYINGGI